jgi:hypothetical protein
MQGFNRHELTTARKEHNCCECNNKVQPSEKYYNGAFSCDGEVCSYKLCLDCDLLHKWFIRIPDLEWDDIPGIGAGSFQWDVAETDFVQVEDKGRFVAETDEIYIDSDNYIRLSDWAKMVIEIEAELFEKRCDPKTDNWYAIDLADRVDAAIIEVRAS